MSGIPGIEGKVAFITGGGRGQGRSHAIALARAGANIAFCDIVDQDPDVPYATGRLGDMEMTAKLVEDAGGKCIYEVVDVRDYAGLEQFARRTVAEFGTIDITVAQAGNMSAAPVHEMSPAQWSVVVDVALTGIFHAIRATSPYMVAQKSGRIIATSSGLGRVGGATMANYVAAKWGVIGLIKSAAKDLGQYNITANALCLGTIDTPMVRNDAVRKMFRPDLEVPTDDDVDQVMLEQGFHHMPIARIDPQDVSNVVVFLASDQARYMSGGTLDVGAGWAANHT